MARRTVLVIWTWFSDSDPGLSPVISARETANLLVYQVAAMMLIDRVNRISCSHDN